MTIKLKLSAQERRVPVWLRIEEALLAELDVLRRQNDAPVDEIQTARLRGRIAELKDLLAIGKDAEVIDAE